MSPRRLIATTFLMAAVGGCQSTGQVEDRLVLAFEEAMFNTGRIAGPGEGSGKVAKIARFSSPVRVSVAEGATPDNQALVRRTLADFASVTGVTIAWREPGDRGADLVILFSDQDSFVVNGNEQSSCYASVAVRDDGVIDRSVVHVSRKDENRWRDECLVHELLHAFGWRGHTHRIRSANSYMHGEYDLTRWDRLLMRTLYDPRMPAGTPKDDAIPRARVILQEILADQ